jgi:thiol-disulfide isomerase/thioredoxin
VRRPLAFAGIAAVFVVLGLSVFLGTRKAVDDVATPSPLLHHAITPAQLTLLHGGSIHLGGSSPDITVISFWASWCGPCQSESPELSTFAWTNRLAHVRVVGVLFNDLVSNAEDFERHYGNLFPTAVDQGGQFANQLGVTSPPTTVVLDRHGRVAAVILGAVTATQLSGAVAAAA